MKPLPKHPSIKQRLYDCHAILGVADFSDEIERASPAQFHRRIKQCPI